MNSPVARQGLTKHVNEMRRLKMLDILSAEI